MSEQSTARTTAPTPMIGCRCCAAMMDYTYKELRFPCDIDLLRSRLHNAVESIPVNREELLKIARELASAAVI
jgi:hypothetical protein